MAEFNDTTDQDALELLQAALACYCEEELSPADDVEVRTYEDAGVLTHNKGLVLRLPDGSEFQVTVVKSA